MPQTEDAEQAKCLEISSWMYYIWESAHLYKTLTLWCTGVWCRSVLSMLLKSVQCLFRHNQNYKLKLGYMVYKKIQRQKQAEPSEAEHLSTGLKNPAHLALTGNSWQMSGDMSPACRDCNHKGLNELHFFTPSCHNLQLSCAPLWCFYFMRFFTQLLPLKFLRTVNSLPEVSQPLYTNLLSCPCLLCIAILSQGEFCQFWHSLLHTSQSLVPTA